MSSRFSKLVDLLVEHFNHKITDLMIVLVKYLLFPISIIRKTKKIKIWITNGLLISFKNRQTLYKQ